MSAKKKTTKKAADKSAEPDPPCDEPGPAGQSGGRPARYVWQRLWFQWVLGTIVVFLFLSFVLPPIYTLLTSVSGVLTPVLLGLGLAYVFNPLVSWGEARWKVPRPASAAIMLAGVALLVLGALAIIVPEVYKQGAEFAEKAPGYTETLFEKLNIDADGSQEKAEKWVAEYDWSTMDWKGAASALGIGASALFTGLGFAAYLLMASAVTAFCFFFFVWKFDALCQWFVPFIPVTYRDETLRILGLMDVTVSAIIRGRLVQSLCVMIVLSLGWWAVGVPYWLLLGVLGGALNLLPYAAIVSWPIAVGLAVLDVLTTGEGSLFLALALPTVVYVGAQSLDGWVVEPLVQGKATGMDTLTVLLVVLAGGALLGVLGMVLAIPAAACIKILSQELLLPRLRAFAADPPDLHQRGSG